MDSSTIIATGSAPTAEVTSPPKVVKPRAFVYKEDDRIPPLPKISSRRLEREVFGIRLGPGDQVTPYRRLEQKGDAVYNAAVVMLLTDETPGLGWREYQFLRAHMVSNSQLSSFAKMYKLDERHSPSTNEKLPADLQEAYIGALYTERGMEFAMEFSKRLVKPAVTHYRNEFRLINNISDLIPEEREPTPGPVEDKIEEITSGDSEGDEGEVNMTKPEPQIFEIGNFGYFMTNPETCQLLKTLMDLLTPLNPAITLKFKNDTWTTKNRITRP